MGRELRCRRAPRDASEAIGARVTGCAFLGRLNGSIRCRSAAATSQEARFASWSVLMDVLLFRIVPIRTPLNIPALVVF